MGGEQPDNENNISLLINSCNLKERIKFCGFTSDIPSKLLNSSIIVMPSAHEGFCLAVAEALSMGVPAVVCKDCSALNTLVTHGKTGFVCSPTPEDIAFYLNKLIEDQELRLSMGKQAQKDMEKYKPELIYDAWERLIAETVKDKAHFHK